MSSVVVGELDGSTPDRRVQVVVDASNPRATTVELRELHHADGLGWFSQGTLRLDANQVAQLLGLLGQSCCRSTCPNAGASPEILAFPTPRPAPPLPRTDRRVDAV